MVQSALVAKSAAWEATQTDELYDLFGISMSLGTINTLQQETNDAIAFTESKNINSKVSRQRRAFRPLVSSLVALLAVKLRS